MVLTSQTWPPLWVSKGPLCRQASEHHCTGLAREKSGIHDPKTLPGAQGKSLHPPQAPHKAWSSPRKLGPLCGCQRVPSADKHQNIIAQAWHAKNQAYMTLKHSQEPKASPCTHPRPHTRHGPHLANLAPSVGVKGSPLQTSIRTSLHKLGTRKIKHI